VVSLFVDLSRSGLEMSNGRMELRLGIVLLWMRASMNTTVKAILGIALVAIAAVALHFGGGLINRTVCVTEQTMFGVAAILPAYPPVRGSSWSRGGASDVMSGK
jgi:hypothetical protein